MNEGIAKGLNPNITWKEYLEFEISNLQKALDEENKKIALENKQ